MKTEKVRTTLLLDKNLIKAIKQLALDRETTQTEVITSFIKEGLEKLIETEEKEILGDIEQSRKEVAEGKYISIKSGSLEERFVGI
ncbi:MAG: hypothetical protein LBU74_04070 [Methanobacteriaceae archaeon]|nr:hypothetical protein [Candidatus Methanorudis spinitermitis]